MRILRGAGYPALRWRNGRGLACRVAALPPEADYDALEWQVSRPRIETDTPFSRLAGLDRQLMLVSGRGLTLRVRSAEDRVGLEQRIDRPLEPFAFRGDWDADCTLLDGPVEVLNVMTRRGRAAAQIETRAVAAPVLVRKAADETLVVYAAGPLTAYGGWGTGTLDPDDSVLVDEPQTCEIAIAAGGDARARAVLIRLAQGGARAAAAR